MIAIDTNVLVYAHRPESPLHGPAAQHVAALANGDAAWAIAWPTLHEFLAVVTHKRVYVPPTPMADALAQIEGWLMSPSLKILNENAGYLPALAAMLTKSGVTGPKVHDARIAALCIAHGVDTILTMDRDFSAFPELKVRTLTVP